jgi:predicted nuclease of predicted toxin-antitoxin system
VKLLFDENLSPRLVQALEPEYPGSSHVRTLGLRGATDGTIWERARQDTYTIVSKDNDFRQLSFLHGAPPKVIWLSVGKAGTESILRFLRSQRAQIESFEADPEASLLVLTLTESAV